MAKNVKKHKFNAVDAILIILILAIIGAAVFFFVLPGDSDEEKNDGEEVTVEYEVQVKNVRNELKDVVMSNWTNGDTVYDAMSAYVLGTLVDVRAENATYVGTDMTGEEEKAVVVDYPGRSNLTFVIRSSARITDVGRYAVDDGYDVSVGTGVYVRMPYYSEQGYCTVIREITDDAEEAK